MKKLQQISYILPSEQIAVTKSKSGAMSERAEYVGKFCDKLNFYNKRDGYRVWSYSRMGKTLAHLNIQDLHYFWKKCNESDNFGRCFHGMLKVHEEMVTHKS